MSENYTLREVHVEVRPGVTLIADVSSIDGLAVLIRDLAAKDFAPKLAQSKPKETEQQGTGAGHQFDDTPSGRIETNAAIPKGSLAAKNILAFKDDLPQLLRPGAFANVTEATLVLIHAVERGLKTPSIEYEAFKGLYEAQNIKSGTPLPMLISNLRNSGYIDKKAYQDGRKLRLTPKGDKKAVEIVKEQISQQ